MVLLISFLILYDYVRCSRRLRLCLCYCFPLRLQTLLAISPKKRGGCAIRTVITDMVCIVFFHFLYFFSYLLNESL